MKRQKRGEVEEEGVGGSGCGLMLGVGEKEATGVELRRSALLTLGRPGASFLSSWLKVIISESVEQGM